MDNIYCLREAKSNDKEAVLEILANDNAYDGLDYLPDYYDYFQNSKHVTSYVYTENGKIIAYVACLRVDNGETMVTRAGRVSSDRRGKQVYKRFIAEVEKRQTENGLPVHHALLKSTDPSASLLRSYKPVATKAIYMFECHRSSVSSKLKSFTADYKSKAKVIENIPAYFLTPPYSNYLFPEGRVIVDWVPFCPKQTNIPLFKGKDTVFFSNIAHAVETKTQSHAVETKTQREINETATHQENSFVGNIQGLLSACTLIKTYNCFDLSCIIDIFGNDIRSLRDHIIAHLQRIENTGLENINLIVVTAKGACETTLLDDIIEPFEIDSITSGPRKEHYIEQAVYEKEIE